MVDVCNSFLVVPFLLNCTWQFNLDFIWVVEIWCRHTLFLPLTILEDLVDVGLLALFAILPFSLKSVSSVEIGVSVRYVVVYS